MSVSVVFRRVAWTASVILLVWTAADLSNYRICALDQEGFPGSPAEHEPLWPAGDGVHVDDCFCCSHCVEPGFRFDVDESFEIVGAPQAFVTSRPHADPPSLDHPPQRTA